ncbi:hypothetical protein PMIT1313_02586 [Prochlorococcus marinus str. MIT 1313]|uniref:hypothetical protein n=1 Tax=Prochlorococcus TaxID=1218 RepID=UPI0007BBEE93|nr:hypothetical protein [Prochlorococcus marinus]KZR68066.1 hypothetical protein PMIT1313_02586 [Prochlorococcus marinus str. MIT 1313]KZR78497.1 hypothetical protein PMIT1318_00014 [Prochlorococcus marinus str. MIT 1318]
MSACTCSACKEGLWEKLHRAKTLLTQECWAVLVGAAIFLRACDPPRAVEAAHQNQPAWFLLHIGM